MPLLVERGHIYIAQPPLYKVKHGKDERYLKDDAELAQYMVTLALKDAQLVPAEGAAPIEGNSLAELARQYLVANAVVERVARVIDRATLEATRVGDGTKIDDLVMVGHNSAVGRHVILCGQVGLAGSTVVGDGVVLAGQVGVAGHLTIGPGAKAGAQTGIASDVDAGETVFGTPHMSHREALRAFAELRRLPETARALRALLARDVGRETIR